MPRFDRCLRGLLKTSILMWISAASSLSAGEFDTISTLASGRSGCTATLMTNGEVLIAGGLGIGDLALASTESCDLRTGRVVESTPLAAARSGHTALLLRSGRVLVTGGTGTGGVMSSCEIFDPKTRVWSAAAAMGQARSGHTATMLPDGRVLVAGGQGNGTALASVEIYNPAVNQWTVAEDLGTARHGHTASLLQDGRVLVLGGLGGGGQTLAVAEIYDVAANQWDGALSMGTARHHHTATRLVDGRVLVVAGQGSGPLTSAEIFQPATGLWSSVEALSTARSHAAAILLVDGRVLVLGGQNAGTPLAASEIFDPVTGDWSSAGDDLTQARHSAAALLSPQGDVWVVGGQGTSGKVGAVERWRHQAPKWLPATSLPAARYLSSSVLLTDGNVLMSGGSRPGGTHSSAVVYQTGSGQWAATGSLLNARYLHTSTLLHDGRVLVVGGLGSNNIPPVSCEIFDPVAGTWSASGNLGTGSYYHTATLLWDGRLLLAGGTSTGGILSRAALFDPLSGAWQITGSLMLARSNASASLLKDGRVMVSGGITPLGLASASVEIYDPVTGAWSSTGSMVHARSFHTSNLLPDGRVLVTGGNNDESQPEEEAEIYDPGTGLWSVAGSIAMARYLHESVSLPSGEVVILGGLDVDANSISAAEIFDPHTSKWTMTTSMPDARYYMNVVLLGAGKVLVAGGIGSEGALDSAAVYDPGSLANLQSRPLVNSAIFDSGDRLMVDGSGFTDRPEAGGGTTQNSAVNHPMAQLKYLTNGYSVFVEADSASTFSDSLFSSAQVRNVPVGHALLTLYSAGVPSAGKIVYVPEPAVAKLRVQQPVGADFASGGQTNFGLVLVGQESSRTFVITNAGRADLISTCGLEGEDATMFSITTSPTSPLSGPGSNTELTIRYRPTGPGPRTAMLRISSNDPDRPDFTALLRGTSFSSDANLSGLEVSYGTFAPAFSQAVTAYSLEVPNGISTLKVTPSLAQAAATLKVNGVTVSSGQASPNFPLNVGVTSIQIVVTAEDGVAQKTYGLSVGRSGPVEMLVEEASGSALVDGGTSDFGPLLTGSALTKIFTIRNLGSDNLTGLQILKEGSQAADFEVLTLPAAPLAGGGTTTFSVRFTASSGGAKTAFLRISSNDVLRNPYDIRLTGHSLAFNVDGDSDGLSDASEFQMASLGFDWQVAQASRVQTYFSTASGAGLYNSAQIETLHVGKPLLRRDPQTGHFTLTMGLRRSTNLSSFTSFPFTAPHVTINAQGKLEFRFNPVGPVEFFKVDAE